MENKVLTPIDFEQALGEKLSPRVVNKIKDANLIVSSLTVEERDSVVLSIIKTLLNPEIERVGSHRIQKWERGWGDNLAAFKEGREGALVPYYFRNDAIARWRGEFVRPAAPGFDYKSLEIILEWLYELYMASAPSVYEFGCGTGHHLIQLRDINKTANLWGLDWAEASQQIIAEMVKQNKLTNAFGKKFDFFNPDTSFELEPNSVIYTCAALEQVGENHDKFLAYLMGQSNLSLAVHIEPIAELLSPDNLLDYLSIEYFQRRNYLQGFLSSLRKFEAEGKIKIHRAQRTNIGGNMFVEHYQVIVWSPIKQ